MIVERCAAAWLFASTVCWPRSWRKPSIFSNRWACSASCWRSNAEPSSGLSSQSRLSRRPKRRASSEPEQSFENAPFFENCCRNLAASSRRLADGRDRPHARRRFDLSRRQALRRFDDVLELLGDFTAALQQRRGLLVEAHLAHREAELG